MPRRPLLLIVEDDSTLRELYRVVFSLSNFTVHACRDGLEALEYLEQECPEIIVLDLNLPVVSGTAVYEEIRAHPRTQSVPVVVVTGVDSVPDLPGATILRKPCSPERVLAAVEQVLIRHDSVWLFTRGPESVWITRVAPPRGHIRLQQYGPGAAEATYDDPDQITSANRHAALMRDLVMQGYQRRTIAPVERRSGRDRRSIPRGRERRRTILVA